MSKFESEGGRKCEATEFRYTYTYISHSRSKLRDMCYTLALAKGFILYLSEQELPRVDHGKSLSMQNPNANGESTMHENG